MGLTPVAFEPEFNLYQKVEKDPYDSDTSLSSNENDGYKSDEEMNKKYSFISNAHIIKKVSHKLKKEEYVDEK
jgi:hypothetical protein